MTLIVHENDTATLDLIEYYKKRLEVTELEYQQAIDQIDSIKISHSETHKLAWEVLKRTKEVNQLQQALGDFQAAVFEERKKTMAIVAENDSLKIQELKDRKKIRFLLSLSGAPEEEVTYFRERLDKRLVKISRVYGSGIGDVEKRRKHEEQDLLILEDEVEGLKLTVSSLETQLQEQNDSYENAMAGLMKERRVRQEEERIRRDYDEIRIEELLEKVSRMRTLCRENTSELLRTKKVSSAHGRQMMEETTNLKNEIKSISQTLVQEQERNEIVERTVETRVVKKQDHVVSDLRSTIKKLEAELKSTKDQFLNREASLNQKIEYLKSKFNSVNSNYTALKKRRDYEIEGFTADIVNLRTQLRTLEKSLLKYGSLEDKELVLLNLARLTGERAGKISEQLQNLKAKVYTTERQVQELDF